MNILYVRDIEKIRFNTENLLQIILDINCTDSLQTYKSCSRNKRVNG